MPCTVELLSVGNELLLGNTVNTNAAWLAAKVTSLGSMVTRTTTVRDDLEDISKAIKEAIRRKPDFVITTGGIGPTFDDMTIKAVAKALHLRLGLNRTALKMIREHYARRFADRKISLTPHASRWPFFHPVEPHSPIRSVQLPVFACLFAGRRSSVYLESQRKQKKSLENLSWRQSARRQGVWFSLKGG